MLVSFSAKNLLFFEDFNINFSDRLNVLTGETGAGKSVIIRALQALVGKKVDLPALEGCELQALFVIPEEFWEKGKEFGIEGDEIVVSLSVGKRWVYRVNGKLVPQSFVEEFFEDLVQFHQQNSQTGILKKHRQLLLVDKFHQNEHLINEYHQYYNTLRELERFVQQYDAEKLEESLQDLKRKIDLIEKVNPSLEEETRLQERYNRLMKHREIAELLSEIVEIIDDEREIGLQRLYKISQRLERAKVPVPDNLVNLLEEIAQASTEVGRICRKVLDELDMEDAKSLEERISLYNELKRKFGPTVEDVLNNYKRFVKEYKELSADLEKLKTTDREIENLRKKATELAERLHEERTAAAKQLETLVRNHMKDLALNLDFIVKIEKLGQLGPSGFDEIEMMVRSHTGELVSIRNVLSGGELSRLMLSIELACVSRSVTDILVFDEVDAGIGGLTGNILGTKLKQLSQTFQTIVVTHLPQVARLADTHILVEKSEGNRMSLKILNNKEKAEEILRMIGGKEVLKEGKDLLE